MKENPYQKNDRLMKELQAELEDWAATAGTRDKRAGRRYTDRLVRRGYRNE